MKNRYETTAAFDRVHGVRRTAPEPEPVATSEREQRTPSFWYDYFLPVIMFAAFVGIAGLSISGGDGWIGLGSFGIAGALGVVLRTIFWDLTREVKHTDKKFGPVQNAPETKIRPEIQERGKGTANIQYGTFSLTRDNWQRFATAVFENGGTLTRKCLETEEAKGIFPSITKRFPGVLSECKRLGWVDESKQLTEAGIEWMARFTSPTLPENMLRRSPQPVTTTTTTETTGMNGDAPNQ